MSVSSPQGNTLKFKHAAIRALDQDQKNVFQTRLEKSISHFKRSAPFEEAQRKLSNHEILREMNKLLTHLNHIYAASGPESKLLSRHFWGQYSGWKASDSDRKVIAGFPRMVELMRRIVDDSIKTEAYKIVPLATEKSFFVAMEAAQLLRQFGIKLTITDGGVWFALTKYIFLHGYGRDEKPENIRNHLKRVKGYFTA